MFSNGPRNGAGGVVRDAFGDCYRPMERVWLVVEESTDEGLEKEEKAAARAAERQKKQRLQGVRGLSKRTVSKRPKVKAGWHGEPCLTVGQILRTRINVANGGARQVATPPIRPAPP